MPSFFMEGESSEFYFRIRHEPELVEIKNRLEALYRDYASHADTNFVSDARNHLHQRYWEMLSCVALLKKGFNIEKHGDAGLEFSSMAAGTKIWFEAICATPGKESSPGYFTTIVADLYDEHGEGPLAQEFKEDDFLTRITAALQGKYKKITGKDAAIIGETSAVVILLNSAEAFNNWMPRADDQNGVPLFAKALFPIGRAAAPVMMPGEPQAPMINVYRDTLRNHNNSPINTNYFQQPGAERISAVIHSMLRVQDNPYPLGSDFVIALNPSAKVPLPTSAFEWCKPFSPPY